MCKLNCYWLEGYALVVEVGLHNPSGLDAGSEDVLLSRDKVSLTKSIQGIQVAEREKGEREGEREEGERERKRVDEVRKAVCASAYALALLLNK